MLLKLVLELFGFTFIYFIQRYLKLRERGQPVPEPVKCLAQVRNGGITLATTGLEPVT